MAEQGNADTFSASKSVRTIFPWPVSLQGYSITRETRIPKVSYKKEDHAGIVQRSPAVHDTVAGMQDEFMSCCQPGGIYELKVCRLLYCRCSRTKVAERSSFADRVHKMRILLCHPEFWLGGAEAVIFDIILALRERGHIVYLVTGHCDQFWMDKLERNVYEMISSAVSMAGDWFHGMQYLALKAWFKWGRIFDLIILDACPCAAPLLKLLFRRKIFYYCHFPYQMMVPRSRMDGLLMFIEMWVIEAWCLRFCDLVSTNSLYTTRTVHRYLSGMTNRNCKLLYPAVPYVTVNGCLNENHPPSPIPEIYFLSLNRYWPDKRIDIALSAFAHLRNLVDDSLWDSISLVVAGSVEKRMTMSLECVGQLHQMARDLDISSKVAFLEDITAQEKVRLLSHCLAVLYTSPMEHFGITPIEAGHFGKPVIAVDSCGCKETINNGYTGLLVDFSPQGFAKAMAKLLLASKDELEKYAANCTQWIDATFGLNVFKKTLFYHLELVD